MLSEKMLRNELESLTDQKTWVEKRIVALRIVLESPSPLMSSRGSRPKAIRGGKLQAISSSSYSFIMARGRPVHRETLLRHLEAEGVEVRGESLKQRLAMVSSSLSLDKRFISMGRSTGLWEVVRGEG